MRKSKKKNLILLLGSIIALLIIFMRQFILKDIPEWFRWGEEFGELLFNLCVGYLVTYWFYYLTIYREEKKKSEYALKFIRPRVIKISHSLDTILEKIYSSQDEDFYFLYPDINSFKTEVGIEWALSRLNLQSFFYKNEKFPETLNQKWWEQFHQFISISKKLLGEIERYEMDLDIEISQLFNELLINGYLDNMSPRMLSNAKTIEYTSYEMCRYMETVERLREKFES